MRRFVKTSMAFLTGLACVLLATDRFIGWRIAKHNGKGTFAPEVYVSLVHASMPSSDVRTIYLGDSVAHQLFPPGREGSPDERFLPSNQAISMAGQYYLCQDALDHLPNARQVYLFYYPGSFENDLGPPLSNDYFCGYFHRPRMIVDVFRATHDVRLLACQVGRWMLPHILDANSENQPMMVWGAGTPTSAGGGGPNALGSEPLLTLLNRLTGGDRPDPEVTYDSAGRRHVALSNVSIQFLARMRELCRRRGVTLNALPCPCSDAVPFVDTAGVYDGPFLYEPQEHFIDAIHLKRPYIDAARQRIIREYRLPAQLWSAPGGGAGR